jgi:hypothetical protein
MKEYKMENKDITLNSHKKINLDEWKIKEILEKDNFFYNIPDTNYVIKQAKIEGNEIILVFEKIEEKKDAFNNIIWRLNFLGSYKEVKEEELKEELKGA